jgi:hypothetical protein
MYDYDKPYETQVLEQQGKKKHNEYIASIKWEILELENTPNSEAHQLSKLPSHQRLAHLIIPWQETYQKMQQKDDNTTATQLLKGTYKLLRKARRMIKNIYNLISKIRNDEWKNAKTHAIQTGKYGTIARMINPKSCNGPMASNFYPAKPGETKRYATNDDMERQEASIITHTTWMSNPPGRQNCHFLDLIHDEVGPCRVEVKSNKQFDITAQMKYLDGILDTKVNQEIEEHIKLAHRRLPKVF